MKVASTSRYRVPHHAGESVWRAACIRLTAPTTYCSMSSVRRSISRQYSIARVFMSFLSSAALWVGLAVGRGKGCRTMRRGVHSKCHDTGAFRGCLEHLLDIVIDIASSEWVERSFDKPAR